MTKRLHIVTVYGESYTTVLLQLSDDDVQLLRRLHDIVDALGAEGIDVETLEEWAALDSPPWPDNEIKAAEVAILQTFRLQAQQRREATRPGPPHDAVGLFQFRRGTWKT